jgi:hypothetical protein
MKKTLLLLLASMVFTHVHGTIRYVNYNTTGNDGIRGSGTSTFNYQPGLERTCQDRFHCPNLLKEYNY